MHERRYAGEVERLRNPERLALLEVEKVVDLTLRGISAQSVLDIGVGTAVFAEAFARHGLRAYGIDVRLEMLQAARALFPLGRYQLAVAEALPHRTGAVDIAFLGLLLHESDEPVLTFAEAWRVAKKRVAILEWPFVEEEHGPPLEHRLRIDQVQQIAQVAGARGVWTYPLAHTVLHIADH
ncbi:MAG: class I SAM-dependent methyltransferase [candidate division KSB1 bacterium]|nr:class I SAM-dependent methyltransferase [candidate division KSB1 bacterium]MDZ7377868.1 class I SAM-dependent methyltransferase [candidate division KSB1 bacterium]MDZ7386217.1 class I SAM-dependent methyltransferase [candidate division KSB1 bacterium]MDZ7393010.1 class I SAM-dependent methyltransferase [candidate division KSB1 bacterium]MDZ7412111.1 class I SAM-dependent methyltransferase [candidate division KSB1 bacterium]